jgi:hypothetical protein
MCTSRTFTGTSFPPSRIFAASGEVVKAETSFAVIRTSLPDGAMTVLSAGRYLDEIVLEGARTGMKSGRNR